MEEHLASCHMSCFPSVRDLFCPGTPTIPDQIVDNRSPYFEALDAADDAYSKGGIIDVSKMEELIGTLLATQLAGFYRTAGGKIPATAAI
jgi:hypothetical protein